VITHTQMEEPLNRQKEHAKSLGEILLEAGHILKEQLQCALSVQNESRKKKLGQIFVEHKYITYNDICVALGTQMRLPWAGMPSLHVPQEVIMAIPEYVVGDIEVSPVERKDATLIVTSGEPERQGLIGEITRYTRLKIEWAVACEGCIKVTINRLLRENLTSDWCSYHGKK